MLLTALGRDGLDFLEALFATSRSMLLPSYRLQRSLSLSHSTQIVGNSYSPCWLCYCYYSLHLFSQDKRRQRVMNGCFKA